MREREDAEIRSGEPRPMENSMCGRIQSRALQSSPTVMRRSNWEKKQFQFRAQCRASWHDSSTSHFRLASRISTTIKDARRRRIDSLPGQVGEAKGEAHSMSPWFRWRHDVSSPLGWGGLGIPIWEGKRHGPPPRRPMLECNPGKATGARELHEAEVIAD